ncbi:MAG TPA: shikimate dehydrogenase [Caulobacter sp.]|nr:shikimate dehydrogenase [Caulobacter sp.]
MTITGATLIAGIAGSPVAHSMSPVLHNAWLAAAGIDGAYVPFAVPPDGFGAFANGLRGGVVRGINVTIPFKEQALGLADSADDLARLSGAANLLTFAADGTIAARNTDGPGMLAALQLQAPGFDPAAGPAVILGAGGAARGAAATLVLAGAPQVRLVNRTRERAEALAQALGSVASAFDDGAPALADANLIVNATSLGLGGGPGPEVDFARAPPGAVVMDMVYKPLDTLFLQQARAAGRRTVDGLEMLIRQAVPSFEAFFGQAPPPGVDVRALALRHLGAAA